ncbi:alpha/beta hydrolase [Alphaproteobacteria bacterium KMM 3653]|uniref:Alpha/beta hydrolase n=1 Tax=Harenicola maris TaxID=2841044 RepID=A0AAP2G530_9RHOB|nr:alpha/beta hydrolase [Harenicola maris]
MPSFTTGDGTRIAYSDSGGSGPPLLCLAGLTRNGRDFGYLAPHIEQRARLIRPDYRGRGGSGWTGADSYTIPQEMQDQIDLLDHLGLDKAAILGTSRGGLIGLVMAAAAKDRLMGLCLNDVGPVINKDGLSHISGYIGRNPAARSHAELAQILPGASPGFANVPDERWLEEARIHYDELPGGGLAITYDPALRSSFLAAYEAEAPDLWPLFDACAGLPLALIHGANSNLLTAETAAEMRRRRPDMIYAAVPDRGHVPFLDEGPSLAAINSFLDQLQ